MSIRGVLHDVTLEVARSSSAMPCSAPAWFRGIGKAMRERLVALGWGMAIVDSARVLTVLLLGALGCATSDAAAERRASAEIASPRATSGSNTEQVVQRVMPAPVEAAPGTGVPANRSDPRANAGDLRGQRKPPAAISSKHLEAELNRLEAELGR